MAEKPRKCPRWCAGKHDLTRTHESGAPYIDPWLRAVASQIPGRRRTVRLGGVPVTDPYDADALARVIERLAGASPEQHRELAGQVRAAAGIAFGTAIMDQIRG
jgi:hypothetical protein